HTSAGVCTVTQASGADGLLGIAHHGDEVVLTSTSSVESPLPETGKVDLALVFLDNGRLRHDDGWGTREFTYARSECCNRGRSSSPSISPTWRRRLPACANVPAAPAGEPFHRPSRATPLTSA